MSQTGKIPETDLDPNNTVEGSDPAKDALRLWLRLLSTSRVIEEEITCRLKSQFDHSLARFDLMAVLARYPNGLTMSELGRHLRVSGGNITGLVDRLQREEMVARHPNPQDGRSSYVALTDAGHAAFEEMARHHVIWVKELLTGMDVQDSETLYRLLTQTRANARAEIEKNME